MDISRLYRFKSPNFVFWALKAYICLIVPLKCTFSSSIKNLRSTDISHDPFHFWYISEVLFFRHFFTEKSYFSYNFHIFERTTLKIFIQQENYQHSFKIAGIFDAIPVRLYSYLTFAPLVLFLFYLKRLNAFSMIRCWSMSIVAICCRIFSLVSDVGIAPRLLWSELPRI
jgi:hypothetical protein